MRDEDDLPLIEGLLAWKVCLDIVWMYSRAEQLSHPAWCGFGHALKVALMCLTLILSCDASGTGRVETWRSCIWPLVGVKSISKNNAFPCFSNLGVGDTSWHVLKLLRYRILDGTAICLKFPRVWISRLDSMNWRNSPPKLRSWPFHA